MNVMVKAVVCATALTVASLAWSASPASADHFLSGGENGCGSGPLSGPVPLDVSTDHARVTELGDGTLVLQCIFHDLPSYAPLDPSYFGEDEFYVGPKRAVSGGTLCGHPYIEHEYVYGTYRLTPAGTAIVTCVFPGGHGGSV